MNDADLKSRLKFAAVLGVFIYVDLVLVHNVPQGFDNFMNQWMARRPSSRSTVDSPACPNHFRWIHEDLLPWKETGITEAMVEKGRESANFRLVVLNGTIYVERYRKSFQTRDIFTMWGILQLLQKYPGRVPDLDLNFACGDFPRIKAPTGKNPTWRSLVLPPIFSYCSNNASLDIPFPDWSFWGWPEVNIKPWVSLLNDLMEANKKMMWVDRDPNAYWRGNPYVSGPTGVRVDLMKCNVANGIDWHARLFQQDWSDKSKNTKESNLANQCKYRYKIYVEGNSWSVSQKYILSCDSPALLITQKYYDFFSRGLMPMKHYYPINIHTMCKSINSTVSFGNTHQQEAQQVGREGSEFIKKNLKMDYIYEYMFQLLNAYAKLLRFKVKVPAQAIKISSESMLAKEQGLIKKFMMDSRVEPSSSISHCITSIL